MRIAALLLLVPSLAYAETEIEMPPDHVAPAAPKTAQVDDADSPIKESGNVAPDNARISDRPEADISVTTPAPPEQVRAKWVEPYGAIAGGVELQSLHQLPGQSTGTQNPTVAISRLGLRGGFGAHVTFASEFEASLGGPLGYGSSV